MVEPLTAGKPPVPYRGGSLIEEDAAEQMQRELDEAANPPQPEFNLGNQTLVPMNEDEVLGIHPLETETQTLETRAKIVLDLMLLKQPPDYVQAKFNKLDQIKANSAEDYNLENDTRCPA